MTIFKKGEVKDNKIGENDSPDIGSEKKNWRRWFSRWKISAKHGEVKQKSTTLKDCTVLTGCVININSQENLQEIAKKTKKSKEE